MRFPGAAHSDIPIELMMPAVREFVEAVGGPQGERAETAKVNEEAEV